MNFKKLIFLVLMITTHAYARPSRPFYQAGRALSMGDAYTAVGTGYEAVYYNPAGLAKRNRPKLKIVDIETTVSQGFISLFDGGILKFMNMANILNSVQENPGTPFGIGFALLPQFLVRNFSLGVLFRVQTEATVNAVSGDTNMYSFADLGSYLHYSVAFGGGIVKLGVGGKILNRAELDRTYTADEVAGGGFEFNSQWQEGLGIGWDVGALVTLPVQSLPTFGITVHDLGGTNFADRRLIFTGDTAPAGAPPALSQKINLGYSMIFKHQRDMRSVLAIDVKNVTQLSGGFQDHFHAGWEFSSNDSFYLRAGLNQGRYWTAGLGLDLESLGLEFGTYGENLAPKGATRISDRKYVARYVLSF